MKRSLLVLLAIFSFCLSNSQVIFNEFYVKPDAGNHEFFELYNTSTWQTVDMDCYSLVVLYSGGSGQNAYRGFYVLDFPSVPLEPLGYLVGAANAPFNYQKSSNSASTSTTPDFNWNNLPPGSLRDYRVNSTNDGYVVSNMTSVYDFLYGNKESNIEVKYAFFLFNNGSYVNGFMGGFGTTTVPPDVTSMPLMPLSSNCLSTPKMIDWAKDIKSGEFVIETSGSDNGFIRKYDGKCGEWDKSSNPNPSRPFEHTPNATNGAASGVVEANALSVTTERTVCGTRIDFSITGIINNNRYNTDAVFPIVVQLYKDNNRNGLLEATDSLLTSETIFTASDEFHSFTQYPSPTDSSYFLPLNPGDEYIVVFRTALGCIDKIVSPPPASIETTQVVYCGNQIDFSINRALYDATGTDGTINFTAQIYVDVNNSGKYEAGTDQPVPGMSFPINRFNDTVTQVLPTGYENKNYIVVYTSASSGCTIEAAFKAEPSEASLTVTRVHQCGDPQEGDVLMFDITSISEAVESREFPVDVLIYYDNTTEPTEIGTLDDKDVLQETIRINSVDDGPVEFRPAFDQPVILVFKSKRGCILNIIPSEKACTVMPVTFSNFHAARAKQTVALKWETASEQNNRGFNIQRNTRGVWETVAFVFSAASGGNSSELLSYAYNDPNSEKGVSQYRIQQVDLDGKASYSVIRSVKGLEQAGAKTVVYPNPSTDGKVSVVFEDQGAKAVTVSDMSGRIVRRYQGVLNNLAIEGLESGMYSIQITDLSSAVSTTEKVIIKKR